MTFFDQNFSLSLKIFFWSRFRILQGAWIRTCESRSGSCRAKNTFKNVAKGNAFRRPPQDRWVCGEQEATALCRGRTALAGGAAASTVPPPLAPAGQLKGAGEEAILVNRLQKDQQQQVRGQQMGNAWIHFFGSRMNYSGAVSYV